ncbi:cysteate synthase [Amycolatopsis rhizosphaerae]|uniref:Cysteate synthase n=1 Tax=Amycolatopsis rhizosphaerae TaxID=2053003 RepID=A0A558APM5_9PSEU|nr:cysteate synthase [Amycolatopsis rhizosphaerae]TVT26198.1 cysteate synthase [Amycolatopsis rhizosphaerae]
MAHGAAHAHTRRTATEPHYRLRCQGCDALFEDDGFLLECPNRHEPALVVAEYRNTRFEPDAGVEGVFRYRRWLPGTRVLAGAGSGATYRSERLNRVLGLPGLWVAFNGYWPERGATLGTATFKELEVWPVLSRIPRPREQVLVVASAGNTAAAFARACSLNTIPCLIILPVAGAACLRFPDALHPCVKIVSLTGCADYSDAIALANRVARVDGFVAEGGVKNIAKREGLGTTVLNAVETIGRIPDYYFQSIGSGAGAIAVYDATMRLTRDGRFGRRPPRLVLSQNQPFVPVHRSWRAHRRELVEIDDEVGKNQIRQITAHVLSNRRPAYSVRGGVYDVLTGSGGDTRTADNLETLQAKRLFEEVEGIDIDPAGAVALATLIKTARYGGIDRRALILLNITGGGRRRQHRGTKLRAARVALEIDGKELQRDETLDRVVGLFR